MLTLYHNIKHSHIPDNLSIMLPSRSKGANNLIRNEKRQPLVHVYETFKEPVDIIYRYR